MNVFRTLRQKPWLQSPLPTEAEIEAPGSALITVIPEPATALLLGIGCLAMGITTGRTRR